MIAVLKDAEPTAIFTTSAIEDTVAPYAVAQGEGPVLVITRSTGWILDSRRKTSSMREATPETAYLKNTSRLTRSTAGVMVTTRNLSANYEQQMAAYFPDHGRMAQPNTTSVSWLPFYHDMGLMLGVVAPILGGWKSVVMTPIAFVQRPTRWMQALAK